MFGLWVSGIKLVSKAVNWGTVIINVFLYIPLFDSAFYPPWDEKYSVVSNYLRQVNEVNGEDNVFVRCMRFCVCVQQNDQSDQFKTVKATVFKFDSHVTSDSPDMSP